jgi:hypothetical protein
MDGGIDDAPHKHRLRWQPERFQSGTQWRWLVVEQQLGETRQRLESEQHVCFPSPKLFSFRGLHAAVFLFRIRHVLLPATKHFTHLFEL